MKETVSIIVPVYNCENYLENCVKSLTDQTYSDIEIVLVNDGSEDNSAKICDSLKLTDSRITVIHQENKGVSAARNKGIEISKGKYFMFVDSDDTISDNAVEFLLNDATRYNADIVSAVKSTINENGEIHSPYDNREIHIYEGKESLILSLQYERQTNSACAKLFRREMFADIRFCEGRSINEDGYFLFQCFSLYPVYVQHNVSIYQYYIRNNSNSRSRFSEKYLDMLYFSDLKSDYIAQHEKELKGYALNMEISTRIFFLEVLCRANWKDYSRLKKDSISFIRKNYKKYHTQNKHEKDMSKIIAFGLFPIYHLLFVLLKK